MEIEFYKIEINSMDYILVNFLTGGIPDSGLSSLPFLAHSMCRRKTGIGAEGVIFLLPGDEHQCRAYILDRFGKIPAVEFDGLLCAARYAFDYGIADRKGIVFETATGEQHIDCVDSANFRISLKKPEELNGNEIEEKPDISYSRNIIMEGQSCAVTPIRLQACSAILFFPDTERERRYALNTKFESNNFFTGISEPVQLIFSDVYSREELAVQAFFRRKVRDGCFASGAAGVAAVLNGFAEREQVINFRSGEFFFQWLERDNTVLLTGTPKYTFSGSFYMDDEKLESLNGETDGPFV